MFHHDDDDDGAFIDSHNKHIVLGQIKKYLRLGNLTLPKLTGET